MDNLVLLESAIRDSFINKRHLVSIFFDLEKAYDTTWKYGILHDLFEAGLRGRLPMFISEFLSDRVFKVRVGNTFSNDFTQEMGVPQGSILSVTLFSLKINSLVLCLQRHVQCSLYVDDLCIYYSSSHMPAIETKLQHVSTACRYGVTRTDLSSHPPKLYVFIFVNKENYIWIHNYIFTTNLSQLLTKQSSLALFLIGSYLSSRISTMLKLIVPKL